MTASETLFFCFLVVLGGRRGQGRGLGYGEEESGRENKGVWE